MRTKAEELKEIIRTIIDYVNNYDDSFNDVIREIQINFVLLGHKLPTLELTKVMTEASKKWKK